MSRGFGAVQRRVLSRLAENTADPARDLDVPPFYQSWTPLTDLVSDTGRSEAESARRAVHKLAAAGVVETMMLCSITWRTCNGDGPHPGERQRVGEAARRIRDGVYLDPPRVVTVREYPVRSGFQRLHARLVR